MTFYGLLLVSIVAVLLLAEIAPEAINALLILLLLGVVLMRYDTFVDLTKKITSIGK